MENKLIDANETMKMIDEAKVKYETSKNFAENIIRFSKPVFIIPENPTNGDMIRALFPNCEWFIIESLQSVNVTTDPSLSTQTFDIYWWNAPYRKEG